MSTRNREPPALADRLMQRVLASSASHHGVLGDLREEYQSRLRSRSVLACDLWYWRQALLVFWRFRRESKRLTPRRRGELMSTLWQDVRFGLRNYRRSPVFTSVVVLTMALGIGATTAVFSVVNGVLLRPLPYASAERLAIVWQNDRATGTEREAAAPADYFDFRERGQYFEDMAMYMTVSRNLARDDGEPRRVTVARVTANLGPLLGIAPRLGRHIDADEDRPNGPAVAVLANGFWRSVFDADPTVLGRTVRLDEQPFTIIGVLPAGVEFPTRGTDLWTPIQFTPATSPRVSHFVQVIGRLAPGATVEAAHADMVRVAAELEAEFPANQNRGAFVEPLVDVMRGDVRLTLWVVFAAVGAVLLIACANVANLLLARAATRSREVAICAALGASSRTLARRFVVESLLLAVAAAAGGIGLAVLGLRGLLSVAPAELLELGDVRVDLPVLGFALITSVGIGVVFSLIPTLQARRMDLQDHLKEGRAQGEVISRSKINLRRLLVVAQLAVALVLLVSAGLLIRTVHNYQRVDPGFAAGNLLRMDFQLPRSRYPQDFGIWPAWPEVLRFNADLVRNVEALPGVRSAAITSNHPLQAGFTNSFQVVGRVFDPSQGEMTTRMVTPGYFQTVGVSLLAGRFPTEADHAESQRVVVLNREAAERHFSGVNPIGERLMFWGRTEREVIGVVENERMHGLSTDPPPAMYVNLLQAPQRSRVTLIVRTAGDPESLIAPVRQAIWSLDADLAVFNVSTMDDTLIESFARERFASRVLAVFAGVAAFLALLGVYGVLSYLVAQRTHEVGLRLALGATSSDVLRLVVSQGVLMSAIGIGIGLVGALVASRAIRGLLFGVAPTEPLTYLGVVVVLAAAAILASVVPARRAARVDPLTSLRGSG